MHSTFRQVIASVLKVDWSGFEGLAALRCTVGVAIPLLVGLAIEQSAVRVFGVVGAVGVGFGSFQGLYRSRAEVMLLAAVGMAFSVFIGSLAGHSIAPAIGVAALWGFFGGLLVALGKAASFVGLQSIIALLIAGGFPSDLEGAVGRTAFVFGGGLVQTLLVVVIWPLRRFEAERRSLAAVYRSLAVYARAIPLAQAAAPEPHTFAATASPLDDPQPFARSGETLVFQALLDEAERIRASLGALAVHHQRLLDSDRSCAGTLSELSASALTEIAAALEEGRAPQTPPGLSQSLADCSKRISTLSPVEPLLAQLRAAWRMADVLAAAPKDMAQGREHIVRRQRRPGVKDTLITLHANLSLRSTACRHALRLAASLSFGAGVAHLFALPRGYWLPLAIAVMLRPDFHDTFAFSIARVGGTVLGAVGAMAIAHAVGAGPIASTMLVLGFVWAAYALAATNTLLFTGCITGYVVFVMTLAGESETTAATARIINTMVAGAVALCAYATWPTWTGREMIPAMAAMLEEQGKYLGALLSAYSHPATTDVMRLDEIRASARLARSNAEAIVERTLAEPDRRHPMRPRTAMGLLAASRRIALATLALRAGLERDLRDVPGIGEFARQVTSSLLTLATALRKEAAAPELPPLRTMQLALGTPLNDTARDETDLIVDSVDTIAELLRKEALDRANKRSANY